MYIKGNIEARLCNHCCNGKAISITHSECVSIALDIQRAMCVHLLSPVACLPLQYFGTLSQKMAYFWEKVMNHKTCFHFLYTFLNLRRIQ